MNSRPTSSGVDGRTPTEASAQHNNQTCDLPGCERIAEERQMSQDGNGRIESVCAQHKKKIVVVATAVTRAAHCEFTGCDRTPRYGTQDGPLSFCQAHKRAGQYTVRNGQLFVATRDGSAFRDNPGTTTVDATAAGIGPASTAATALPHEANASLPVPGSTDPALQKKTSLKKKKNRPCVFPGCEIRPHYGFPGGRNLFCVTHKKDGMVHLQRASTKLQKESHSRKCLKSGLDVAESKAGLKPKSHKEKTATTAEKNTLKQKDRERAQGARKMGGHAGEGPAGSENAAQKSLLSENATEETDKKNTTSVMPSPASALKKESPLPTLRAEAPGLPPSGLAPSDEMRLFQEARESARAAAEASGSGRRPRAPSRKLLEASGKLMCDSIQWMTKEKREEEARFKHEMKEQRKAAAAAGLKFGHRIEALALSKPAGAKAQGDGAGTIRGEIASDGAWTGINASVSSAVWRKLTPAETLLAAGNQPIVDGTQTALPDSKVATTEATDAAVVGTGKQKEREPIVPAAAAKADVSERKRKVVVSADSIVQAQAARKPKYSRQARRRGERGGSKEVAE